MYKIIKRLFDISFSSIAILFFLPMFLLIAAAIKLDSRGRVLFVLRRIGKNGKPFNYMKFRTMYVPSDVDNNKHKKYLLEITSGEENYITKDPRLTLIGRFLRKYYLDELPVLINVLKGDMSLVGRPPFIEFEDEKYKKWAKTKPGLSGLYQISSIGYGSIEDLIKTTAEYEKKESFLFDFKILIKTFSLVLLGKGY